MREAIEPETVNDSSRRSEQKCQEERVLNVKPTYRWMKTSIKATWSNARIAELAWRSSAWTRSNWTSRLKKKRTIGRSETTRRSREKKRRLKQGTRAPDHTRSCWKPVRTPTMVPLDPAPPHGTIPHPLAATSGIAELTS